MRPRPRMFSAHASLLPSSDRPIGMPTVSATVRLWPVSNVSTCRNRPTRNDGDLIVRADGWRRGGRDGDRAEAGARRGRVPRELQPSGRPLERDEHVGRERDRDGCSLGRDVGDRVAGVGVHDLDRQVGGGDRPAARAGARLQARTRASSPTRRRSPRRACSGRAPPAGGRRRGTRHRLRASSGTSRRRDRRSRRRTARRRYRTRGRSPPAVPSRRCRRRSRRARAQVRASRARPPEIAARARRRCPRRARSRTARSPASRAASRARRGPRARGSREA